MKILLSIKPQFAEMIFSGKKKFEFRRSIFKNKSVKTVLVYASSPVQKIIGEFEIDEIVHQDLDALWQSTHRYSGISYDYFCTYFKGKTQGFAIKIKTWKRFESPLCIRRDFHLTPPQSFAYVY